VLDSLLPVLQAVQPHQLATTLNTVAGALEGRGEQLGETMVEFSRLLGDFNPSLPDLEANLESFAELADTYSEAAPDLLDAMATLTTTSQTVVDKQHDLRELYATLTTASVDLTRFLQANQHNIISLSSKSQSTLDVLAKYAPQYPCMLRQLAEQVPDAEAAFGKGQKHPELNRVRIEFIASRGGYEPGVDEPRYDDKRGPRCYPVVEKPDHWPQYPPDGPLRDGSSKPPPPKKPDGSEADDYEDYGHGSSGGGSAPAGMSLANSPMERGLLAQLADVTVVALDDVDVLLRGRVLVGLLERGERRAQVDVVAVARGVPLGERRQVAVRVGQPERVVVLLGRGVEQVHVLLRHIELHFAVGLRHFGFRLEGRQPSPS
jgi:hypothetical protein